MRLTKIARSAAVVAMGAGVVLAVNAGTASAMIAPNYWDATGTPADVVGAHGWGTMDFTVSAHTLSVTANVKDTVSDGHGARVYVRVVSHDASGGPAEYITDKGISASGVDTTNSANWTFDWYAGDDHGAEMLVMECLTEQGVDYKCGDYTTVMVG